MRVVLIALATLTIAACEQSGAPAAPPTPTGAAGLAAGGPVMRGKVLERIDAPPYAYLRLTGPAGETWAAVPQTEVAIGAEIAIADPMEMDGFESKTLNRKFDKLVFGTVASPSTNDPTPSAGMPPATGIEAGMPPTDMGAQHAAAAANPAFVGEVKVAKAAGANARTIAEIYGQKAQLKEQQIAVRGTVVKVNNGILGKNWLHLRDGSGAQASGDNDLTVTTDGQAAVGDVVLVTGVVRLDKDFGAGYAYPVIVEGASVTR